MIVEEVGSRVDLVRAGAVAAGVAGLVWVAKGLVVLATGRGALAGVDLGSLFVAVQALFGVALLGVHRRIVELTPPGTAASEEIPPWIPGQGREGTRAALGARLAAVAVVLGAIHVAAWMAGAGDTAIAATAGLFAGLAWLLAAALLGVATLRRVALPPPAHLLPLAIAAGTVVLLVAFGLIANFRGAGWLEIPVVVIGAAWALLGVALWSRPAAAGDVT